MRDFGSPFGRLCDPLLSPHVLAEQPVWLWAQDGSRPLWANPAGAFLLGATSPAAVSGLSVVIDESVARDVLRLATAFGASKQKRSARLVFKGKLRRPVFGLCFYVTTADGNDAMLIVATESLDVPVDPTKALSQLLDGVEDSVVLQPDGSIIPASEVAARLAPLEALKAAAAAAAMQDKPTTQEIGGRMLVFVPLGSVRPAPVLIAPQERSETALDRSGSQPVAADNKPFRFVWQTDLDENFTVAPDSDLFRVAPASAVLVGRPWRDLADAPGLDPDGAVASALASQQTWSGIRIALPVDETGERLPVEMSGLPMFDRDRQFCGYRGFGVCRDPALRLPPVVVPAPPAPPDVATPGEASKPAIFIERMASEPTAAASPGNVVPFLSSERLPTLTPVETETFGELAQQLNARLRHPASPGEATPALRQEPERQQDDEPDAVPANDAGLRRLLDRLPVAVLVHRREQLLFANGAFFDWTGYPDLASLERAGGVDALFVASPLADADAAGEQSMTIATQGGATRAVDAKLFSIGWQGESALAMILTPPTNGKAEAALPRAQADAQEWRAIAEIAGDALLVVDGEDRIVSVNPPAEKLLGARSAALEGLPLAAVLGSDETGPDGATVLNMLTRAAAGETLRSAEGFFVRHEDGAQALVHFAIGPLGDGRRCVVLRPRLQEVLERPALPAAPDRMLVERSDFIAKVSHEVRTPLNAIIGFADVMLDERFGAIGNDRYRQYIRDIRSSGTQLASLLTDLLDLSQIEAGQIDLSIADLDLNALTLECVAMMQPHASKQRIIIRTALASDLEPVSADAGSVRQIVLNLLSNSIKFTAPGGQVILSTARGERGEAMFRVRDTGVGMTEQDLRAALDPFRELSIASRGGSGSTGLGLPMTKALAEANKARLAIHSKRNSGTLAEVSFPTSALAAE